jgi:hypothetical protein
LRKQTLKALIKSYLLRNSVRHPWASPDIRLM